MKSKTKKSRKKENRKKSQEKRGEKRIRKERKNQKNVRKSFSKIFEIFENLKIWHFDLDQILKCVYFKSELKMQRFFSISFGFSYSLNRL